MRGLLLLITLPLLMVASWLLWQHRFEVDARHPALDLADLVAATPAARGVSWDSTASLLVLQAGTPGQPVVQRLPLPGFPPVEFLLFDYKAQALELAAGREPWSDGRLMIEWQPEGREMEPEYLGSVRENLTSQISCLVARSELGPSLPTLRLEHLGVSGLFLLERCSITVVQETGWWRYGRWFLLAAWFAWAAGVAASGSTSGLGRPLLAAAVWLVCATQWAVPGPWEALRPMAPNFARIPVPPAPPPVVHPTLQASPAPLPPPPAPAADAPAAESLGEINFGGSFLLEIKDKLKQARPLFHLLMFFFPTLLLALLTGRRQALLMAATLAGGIEWAQFQFGYGFDRTDVSDLLIDMSGVGLALVACPRIIAWFKKRRPGNGIAGASEEGRASPGQAT